MTARKKVQRKKAQPRKASRKKAQPAKQSARSPVVTLPRKYNAYFQRHFANAPADSRLQILCCGSAEGIPTDDREIGPTFGALTEQLSAAKNNGFQATSAEVRAIRTWPPDQLRLFRLALIDIFGERGCGRPVKNARFRGSQRTQQKQLTVNHGQSEVVITFSGP